MTTPDTAGLPELPVIGYYGLNNDGYEVISLKESHVLRMFDAGEVTAQPVCLISDALAAVRSAQAAQPERKPLSDAEMLIEFGKLYPQDVGILELAKNNKDYALESIGARHHWAAFKNGARAIESSHGIGEPS